MERQFKLLRVQPHALLDTIIETEKGEFLKDVLKKYSEEGWEIITFLSHPCNTIIFSKGGPEKEITGIIPFYWECPKCKTFDDNPIHLEECGGAVIITKDGLKCSACGEKITITKCRSCGKVTSFML